MATYPRVIAAPGSWTVIPPATTDRTAQILDADVWVSDDINPTAATAQQIENGERFFIAANKTYKIRPIFSYTTSQVRLMDY